MNRFSLLGFVLALPALGAAFFACKKDPKPPASDGPGVFNPSGGKGQGNDGGASGDGGAGFDSVSFPGLVPTGLTANGDSVIVTLRPAPSNGASTGEVVSVALDGSIKVLVPSATSPATPVIVKGSLFYTDSVSSAERIEKLDLANPTATPEIFAQADAAALVVVGDKLFYAAGFGGTGVEVDSIPLTGGSPTLITSDSAVSAATSLAIDNANCYFPASDHIDVAPLTGGPPDTLATGPIQPIGPLVVADGILYFLSLSGSGDAISSVPVGGGTTVTSVPALTQATDLTIADGYFYFTDANGLARAPIAVDGGSLAEGVLPILGGAQSLAIGTSSVFAMTQDSVFRAAR